MGAFPECSFEPGQGNLARRAVDLVLIVPSHLAAQHLPYPFQGAHALPGAQPDDPVLKPAVRPLDFSFRCGGESIHHLYPAFVRDPFPLGVDLVSLQIVLLPYRISSFHEAEYRMAVDIVRQGKAVRKPDALQRYDMVPSPFVFDDRGIEEVTAVIIKAGDQVPPRIDVRRPAVLGGVVLNQLAGIVGYDLSIVSLPDRPFPVKAPFFALSMMVGRDTFRLCFFVSWSRMKL